MEELLVVILSLFFRFTLHLQGEAERKGTVVPSSVSGVGTFLYAILKDHINNKQIRSSLKC